MSVSNNVQGSNILDVLKKKMRATKEESEKFKEECDDVQRKLQVEVMRREEVSFNGFLLICHKFFSHINQSTDIFVSMSILLNDPECTILA